jgi:GMP synthase PP-ATPase subunit
MSSGEDGMLGPLEKEKELFVAFSGGLASTLLLFLASRTGHDVRAVYVDTGLMRPGEDRETSKQMAEKAKAEFIVADAREIVKKKLKDHPLARHKVSIVETIISNEVAKVAKQAGKKAIVWAGRSYNGNSKMAQVVKPFLGMNYLSMVRTAKSIDQLNPDARYHVPAAGLSLRSHGLISDEKLNVVKEATSAVDEGGSIEQRYIPVLFPIVIDEEFRSDHLNPIYEQAVTSVFNLYGASFVGVSTLSRNVDGSDGKYGKVLAIEASDEEGNLIPPNKKLGMIVRERVISSDPGVGRILLKIRKGEGKLAIVLRAMQTYDLIAAEPYYLPPRVLSRICDTLTSRVGPLDIYFDITPKPPGAIEFE